MRKQTNTQANAHTTHQKATKQRTSKQASKQPARAGRGRGSGGFSFSRWCRSTSAGTREWRRSRSSPATAARAAWLSTSAFPRRMSSCTVSTAHRGRCAASSPAAAARKHEIPVNMTLPLTRGVRPPGYAMRRRRASCRRLVPALQALAERGVAARGHRRRVGPRGADRVLHRRQLLARQSARRVGGGSGRCGGGSSGAAAGRSDHRERGRIRRRAPVRVAH